MEDKEYFDIMSEGFERAYKVASLAREKGKDPESFVEIKPAPDLASRVEGILGVAGIAETIKAMADGKERQELAFEIAREISTNEKFEMDQESRVTLAVRAGLSILTEGVLVAPTEGIQGVKIFKNPDGSDYIAVQFAGPIRGAGGTSAALSVALADYCRKILEIGAYKPTQGEIERYLEEIMIYHSRIARLQYLPSEEHIRQIIGNCPICIDGVPSEREEIAIHRNIKRIASGGKEEMLSNKVRGGVGLVICEGIAQKAKSVLKYTKIVGLDWGWLNNIIKVDKAVSAGKEDKADAVFLQELAGGRPILAYPAHAGSFRLRYGRSRMTGIAAKGFNPATMILLDEYIATGTQVKVEKPGKGCIAVPVDTIEGPFVKLKGGRAVRISTADEAMKVKGEIEKIIAVGDMLVTYGDFKKTNTIIQPTSYVEEFWEEQLRAAGFPGKAPEKPSFKEAFGLSEKYNVPMHPRYIYEYQDLDAESIVAFRDALSRATISRDGEGTFGIRSVAIDNKDDVERIRGVIEKMCLPHMDTGAEISIHGDDAQSIASTFGGGGERQGAAVEGDDPVEVVNSTAPFKVMKRSTGIGGRIGRPEKARERLMKPAPHVLFPIGEYGGKERNIAKAYSASARSFGNPMIDVDFARFRCSKGGETLEAIYCKEHGCRAKVEKVCSICGKVSHERKCGSCGGEARGYQQRGVGIVKAMDSAMKALGISAPPKIMKGMKTLSSRDKMPEPLEKGILRSMNGVYIFKDGTCRFDTTDAPMTHFYPKEAMISVEKARELGYLKDYKGNELTDGGQLVEMRHQDIILNVRGGEYLLKVSKFMDQLLTKFYGLEAFYNAETIQDLVGHYVITLSPHTSSGVLGRIIGFTNASVEFSHPYTIAARRRNCDGDEDTTILLLDTLVNFSRRYLPTTIGGTMDAPIVMTVHVMPKEIDDEAHAMEVVERYGLEFYEKSLDYLPPSEFKVELVGSRLDSGNAYSNLHFTHGSGMTAVDDSPKKSMYTRLKTMSEKVDSQFGLMDKLESIDKKDTAKRLILSHFIPDLMGNLHSFSKQTFRCVACNAKYRRVPLAGKCTKCNGKLVLTISRGGIEKYMEMAITLAERYDLDAYTKQSLRLIKREIETVFGKSEEEKTQQINLSKFM